MHGRRTDRNVLWEQTLYLNVLLHEVSLLIIMARYAAVC